VWDRRKGEGRNKLADKVLLVARVVLEEDAKELEKGGREVDGDGGLGTIKVED